MIPGGQTSKQVERMSRTDMVIVLTKLAVATMPAQDPCTRSSQHFRWWHSLKSVVTKLKWKRDEMGRGYMLTVSGRRWRELGWTRSIYIIYMYEVVKTKSKIKIYK